MASYIDIKGKRFLVTGGSSGLGRETAVQLSRRGALVIVTGRNPEKLAQTLSLMEGEGHISHAADLTKADEIAALVDAIQAVDGVVHFAGISVPMPFRMISEKFLDDIIASNFKSVFLLTQRLIAKNKINKGGSIVLASSIAAHTGTVGMGAYSAIKAGLEGVMAPLFLELAPKKIRVNAIAPAIVRTEIFTDIQQSWLDEQEKLYPLGLGRPIDVANAVIFLMSSASSYMTATTLVMDGGCIQVR
ncbi:MAG: SDR family oxidoreductase [Alphaproteobacteria bacterium]|nr:SDR family oxidoreductase [Alphaproteobacteria bacterium]MBV8549607.1 SDR family oxidoreductase [Alphaproteobacteria bacterium]